MRPIHLVHIGGKTRPAVVLTRQTARPLLRKVTVAPITSVIRGGFTEVSVGPVNGLDHASVISCDNVVTVESAELGRMIGHLLPAQEGALALALHHAFDLAAPEA
jgi:mRNA interferase MazF